MLLSTKKEVKRVLHENDFSTLTQFTDAFEAETKMPIDQFMKLAWDVSDSYQSEWRMHTDAVYILAISHDERKYSLYKEVN